MFFSFDSYSYGFSTELNDILYIIAIILAVLTIVYKNPVVSVLFLILLFFDIAGLLILIGFRYIGLSYILVYVGAISILFLFILMLINIRIADVTSETNNDMPLALFIILLFYYFIIQVLPIYHFISYSIFEFYYFYFFSDDISFILNDFLLLDWVFSYFGEYYTSSSNGWDNSLIDITNITSIGDIMYTNYSMWLIITSNLLLLSMVGTIIITISQKNYSED